MSILIKGAKPPKNCWECLCNDLCVAIAKLGGACPFTEQIIGRDMFDAHSGIYPDCPLVEIPPHGRLIDADKLEYCSIGCWAPDEVRPPQDDTEWLISKYEIDEETPTVIESEEE